jgi:hypothetical protein
MKTVTHEDQSTVIDEVCCAELDTRLWNNVEHKWTNKIFLKDSVPEVFHIPLPGSYHKVVTRMWKKAEEAGAAAAPKDFMLLAYDPTPFKSELLMSITKEIPGEEIVKLSGKFISKVFDGPYNNVPKFMKEMNGYLASLRKTAKKHYFYFAYCPKCAKKYGHNLIVDIAEV